MKLAIARGLFLAGALAVASLATAAWNEPATQVVVAAPGEGQCLKPAMLDATRTAHPDQDLLLLIFGLSQSMSARS